MRQAPRAVTSASCSLHCRLPRCGLPHETVAALARLGLQRIGDILDLPRAPLVARFGADLLRQLDRALGREDEPLTPRLPIAPYIAEKSFPEPIAREEDVLASVERLAARLEHGARCARRRRTPSRARPVPHRWRRQAHHCRHLAPAARSRGDPRAVRRAARRARRRDRSRLRLRPRAAIGRSSPSPARTSRSVCGKREDQVELDRLVDRLSARLGRAAGVAAHRAGQSHPRACRACRGTLAGADDGARRARLGRVPPLPRAKPDLSPRPLRLLAETRAHCRSAGARARRPAGALPLAPRLHEVIAAEGPERIEGAWWSEEAGTGARTISSVEDKAGLRFWLFRAGLYRDIAHATPRWFLHGMYA